MSSSDTLAVVWTVTTWPSSTVAAISPNKELVASFGNLSKTLKEWKKTERRGIRASTAHRPVNVAIPRITVSYDVLEVSHIFLRSLRTSDAVALFLRRVEPHLRSGKLATSSNGNCDITPLCAAAGFPAFDDLIAVTMRIPD